MAIRTIKQSLQLFAILEKYDLIEEREHLAAQYSKGRTERTSLLTVEECSELIRDLNQIGGESCDKQRKRILSMAWELNWVVDVPGAGRKVNVPRVDEWCKKYGFKKKGFNSYTDIELPRLVSQFQQMYLKELTILRK